MSEKKKDRSKFLLMSPDGKTALTVEKNAIGIARLSDSPVEGARPISMRRVIGPLYEVTKGDFHAGPAMVNSESYCSGWDRIFGGKKEVGQA